VGNAIGSAIQNVANGLRGIAVTTIVTTIAAANVVLNEGSDNSSESSPEPSTGLVGEQDDKSGSRGNRHVSGPLSDTHGGTGDPEADFDVLTGGKTGPAPEGSGYPEGTRVGENGIAIRPAQGDKGARIDIPARGDKPHETLHYPPPAEKKPW
jgi:filamentous hemagglutinin